MRSQRDPDVARAPTHGADQDIDRTEEMRGEYAQTGRDYMDRDYASVDRDRDRDYTGRRRVAPTETAPTAGPAAAGAAGAAAGTYAASRAVSPTASPTAVAATAPAMLMLLGGLWLIVSRLVWTFQMGGIGPRGTINGVVIGISLALIAMVRLATPASSPMLSMAGLVLGGWMIASPWVFGYAHFGGASRLVWSDVITGAIILLASLASVSTGGGRNIRIAGAPT